MASFSMHLSIAKLYLDRHTEEDEYELNVREILKDLVFHTIKNKPKNVVRKFLLIFISRNIW